MILDPNDYRRNLASMYPSLMSLPLGPELMEKITLLSIGSHVPLLAVLAYALRDDVLGEHKLLRDEFENVKEFYKYDGVEPWEDLC